MKISFITNYFNHHQKSVSDELFERSQRQYRFIATSKMREERKKLGYNQSADEQYVIDVNDSAKAADEAKKWIKSSDMVISGTCPQQMLNDYIKSGGLLFRYSERKLKNGFEITKYPYRFIKWHIDNPPFKKIYLLCAGAYTAADCAKFGLFRNRAYKWGYFPETIYYDNIDSLLLSKDRKEILWCGRFLDWKHPDDVISVAKLLKDNGYSFHVSMIGTGELEQSLKNMTAEYGLSDYISFLGSMSPQQVRQHMEKAGIYLLTSDCKEGWGAVLNEAMNSGCAVVASHAAGSVPYLIDNGNNGQIYRSSNVQSLYKKTRALLDNDDEQRRLGKNAYHTITGQWNSTVAAGRLLILTKAIKDGEKYPELFNSGPCSKAELLGNNWYREEKSDG